VPKRSITQDQILLFPFFRSTVNGQRLTVRLVFRMLSKPT